MRAFAFRLERLLSIRAYREREKEIRLAALANRCAALRAARHGLQSERAENLRCTTEGVLFTPVDLAVRNQYVKRLDRDINRLSKDLAACEKQREQAQAEYVAASRERKILEKLKERRAHDYYRKQLYEDVKVLDEIGQTMKSRSGRE